MIIAGPCLLNDNQAEIYNCIETAKQLYAIDKDILFRCKLWGGGTTPDKYKPGIEEKGIDVFRKAKKDCEALSCGIEIKDSELNGHIYEFDFVWVAARSCQNYFLLESLKKYAANTKIFIKRHPGITVDEIIGIHDICRDIHGYKPVIIERGINTFCRTDKRRWMPDFQGMLRILTERPDIELMFDPSHACFVKEDIFPMVRAACALGVKHFMMEVYADSEITQTDKAHALSVKEFEDIYYYIKQRESK